MGNGTIVENKFEEFTLIEHAEDVIYYESLSFLLSKISVTEKLVKDGISPTFVHHLGRVGMNY